MKSMTGYGSAQGEFDKLVISAEIRTVNNRYLDCNIKMPRAYFFSEDTIRGVVSEYISRGKADVFITIDASGAEDMVISVNEPLLKAYLDAFSRMKESYGLMDDISVMRCGSLPDVLTVEKKKRDQGELAADICNVVERALIHLNAMREAEGERLKHDISKRLSVVESVLVQVEERSPGYVASYREKLLHRMTEVLENKEIDEARILTEAAIFADRVDVSEEGVRLKSHIAQFRETLEAHGQVGRKLDFLIQEMNREINTIGSKCGDLEITGAVIQMKAEIEKIREQAQNIE